ncbi:MAG: leucine-rich repeat protein [Spirochaetes bacterium]|nr:leucine-rich repeat protein [Spirochaetota bacterium]
MKTRTILAFVLIMVCALALTGCAQFFSSFTSMVIRTVAFDANGGSAIASQRTSLVKEMPVSAKLGFALEGWYSDAAFSSDAKISFPYDPLTDATLYAKWLPATEGILYEANGSGYMVSKDPNKDLSSDAVVIPAYWRGKPVTNVASWGFSSLGTIKSVVIPETVATLGASAFAYCSNIQNVETKAAVPPSPATNAFLSCTSLLSISVPSASLAAYRAADGWIVYASKMTTNNLSFSSYTVSFVTNGGSPVSSVSTTLISDVPVSSKASNALEGWYTDASFAAGTKVSFPYDPLANITLYAKWISATDGLGYSGNATGYSVTNYTAAGAVNIPEYWLGKPVTAIESWAFSYASLTSITIPVTVTEIGSSAFKSCTGLASLTIPAEVTSIGANAFRDSTAFTSITIPSKVIYIGDAAFYNSSLTSVRVDPVDPPTTTANVFYTSANAVPTGLSITVPSARVAAYQAAFGWSVYSAKISAQP